MEKSTRANIVSVLCLLIAACGQPSQATPSVAPHTDIVIATPPTTTPTPIATTPTTVEPTQTIFPIPSLEPTYLPTIESKLIPELLGSSFAIQNLTGINEYNLQKITGWDYGFRPAGYCFGPYKWMDQNHLLLFPLTGQDYGMGMEQLSLPLVINLKSGTTWIPSEDNLFGLSSCGQPLWSYSLKILVATRATETLIFRPDGEIINRYTGNNPSLSPSGTKLMTGGVWIDLLTGNQVDFSSQSISGLSTWSSDEYELYTCCYAYGNARTGKAYSFELDGLRYVGRDYGAGFIGIRKLWVMNDTYVLTYWDFYNDAEQGIFPLIEPASQTYKRLQDLTDIPDDSNCRLRSVAPDRKNIWVNCYNPNNYLVNLETFASYPYSGDLNIVAWSSNSSFAWVRTYPDNKDPQILSVLDNQLISLPISAQIETIFWHPNDNNLSFLSEDMQTLILVDAQTMIVQKFMLPSKFHNIIWDQNGSKVALIAEDGSLWQVDYPKMENLEQLTGPIPDVKDISWSPDGNSVAFISGSDIYIVDTIK